MDSISNIPKTLISDVIFKHTGTFFEPKNIDFITAEQIANAIVALDANLITKKKYMKIIEFSYNNLLERQGLPMRFELPESDCLVLNIYLFYN